MKRSTCALPLLAAVLAVLVLPSAALAADIYHFQGETASVEFFSIDPAGCIVTSVVVYANESRNMILQGPPVKRAAADVHIYQYDQCTWQSLICATGTAALPTGSLDIANNLSSASVQATIDAYDLCNGTTQPVTFAITWTGDGEVIRGRQNYSFHYPGYHTSYHQTGLFSNATATGSMTVGGTAVPLEGGAGDLSNANNGSVYSYH